MLYAEITRPIIGAAIDVHNALGCGFQEVIYQRALDIEMRNHGLQVVREKELPILYKGEQIGSRRPDFIVEGLIMVEIKAISELTALQRAQALNYLRVFNFEIGLLINFGALRLQKERVHNNELIDKNNHIRQTK